MIMQRVEVHSNFDFIIRVTLAMITKFCSRVERGTPGKA